MSHSFEFSILFPEFSASSPLAPLEFGAYLAHSHAGSFAFLDSDSPRQELSIDAWVIRIGPLVVELFVFWSLSGFWTCRVDISGSKARNHYSFRFLTALYTGNTVLSRFGVSRLDGAIIWSMRREQNFWSVVITSACSTFFRPTNVDHDHPHAIDDHDTLQPQR